MATLTKEQVSAGVKRAQGALQKEIKKLKKERADNVKKLAETKSWGKLKYSAAEINGLPQINRDIDNQIERYQSDISLLATRDGKGMSPEGSRLVLDSNLVSKAIRKNQLLKKTSKGFRRSLMVLGSPFFIVAAVFDKAGKGFVKGFGWAERLASNNKWNKARKFFKTLKNVSRVLRLPSQAIKLVIITLQDSLKQEKRKHKEGQLLGGAIVGNLRNNLHKDVGFSEGAKILNNTMLDYKQEREQKNEKIGDKRKKQRDNTVDAYNEMKSAIGRGKRNTGNSGRDDPKYRTPVPPVPVPVRVLSRPPSLNGTASMTPPPSQAVESPGVSSVSPSRSRSSSRSFPQDDSFNAFSNVTAEPLMQSAETTSVETAPTSARTLGRPRPSI